MKIKKVVVCGGGVLGSQIAFLSRYWGFDTTICLRSELSIGRTKPKLARVKENYIKTIEEMNATHKASALARGIADSYESFDYEESLQKVEDTFDNLKIELDFEKALEDADIVIESVSEDLDAKIEFYKKMAPFLPEKTILCTNSSSLLPSSFMEYTGRPEKFLALHFANDIHKHNTAEVMMTSKTDPEVFDTVVQFARDIHMIPLQLRKEQPGYLLNSMLIPFLFAGFDLYVKEISTPEDIDLAWKLGTGSPKGPFEIFDIVGLKTAHEIVKALDAKFGDKAPYDYKKQKEVLAQKIDEGKIGVLAGEGFYKYDEKGNKIS